MRLLLVCAGVALALLASAPATASAAATRVCKSADLRYPFEPGGPKTFGVFELQVTGGSCATAHRVAKRWMRRFEANLRGRRDDTAIRFDYVVPNG
ncbi:MAG TPA: hypothetical protein VF587_02810 [Solirubrobacteraceae bacterium]|jgi:hypothetical protein